MLLAGKEGSPYRQIMTGMTIPSGSEAADIRISSAPQGVNYDAISKDLYPLPEVARELYAAGNVTESAFRYVDIMDKYARAKGSNVKLVDYGAALRHVTLDIPTNLLTRFADRSTVQVEQRAKIKSKVRANVSAVSFVEDQIIDEETGAQTTTIELRPKSKDQIEEEVNRRSALEVLQEDAKLRFPERFGIKEPQSMERSNLFDVDVSHPDADPQSHHVEADSPRPFGAK
jgi:hypothetical protein